jgi:hypothetical protein
MKEKRELLRTKEKNLKRKRALLTRFNSQAPP